MEQKIEYYQQVYSLFLKKKVPRLIIMNYLTDSSSDSYVPLADFVGMNLKKEVKWSTSIAIIESVDNIYNEAVSNANIIETKNL
jgi:hypothetical protein